MIKSAACSWPGKLQWWMLTVDPTAPIGHEKCCRRWQQHFSWSTSTRLHFSTGGHRPCYTFLPGLQSTLIDAVDAVDFHFTSFFNMPLMGFFNSVKSYPVKQATFCTLWNNQNWLKYFLSHFFAILMQILFHYHPMQFRHQKQW